MSKPTTNLFAKKAHVSEQMISNRLNELFPVLDIIEIAGVQFAHLLGKRRFAGTLGANEQNGIHLLVHDVSRVSSNKFVA